MIRIEYSKLERLIEEKIRQWAKDNEVTDYQNENANFGYVDGLTLASEITLSLFLEQDGEGIKIIADSKQKEV